MKIIQITDTHFSPTKPHFNGNWEPLAAGSSDSGADLVIHTGDLSVDGADKDEDIAFSHGSDAADLRADAARPRQSRCRPSPGFAASRSMPSASSAGVACVGPDYWVEDRGNWRLIGLDSLLMGFDDARGRSAVRMAADRRWKAAAAAASRSSPTSRCSSTSPDEGDTGYWSVRPSQRQRLYDLIAAHDVALFASGHLHWAWKGRFDNTSLVWAPSGRLHRRRRWNAKCRASAWSAPSSTEFGDDVTSRDRRRPRHDRLRPRRRRRRGLSARGAQGRPGAGPMSALSLSRHYQILRRQRHPEGRQPRCRAGRIHRARRPVRLRQEHACCASSPGSTMPTAARSSSAARTCRRLRAADRNIAMVFQSYALYPHLTAGQNIAVPLAMRRLSRSRSACRCVGSLLPGQRRHRARHRARRRARWRDR